MKKAKFTLFLIFSWQFVDAQYFYLGANSHAQANTLVADPNIASIYTNPAGMASLVNSSINFAFHQVFPVVGLNTAGIWGNMINKNFNTGFSVDNFGDQYYHESRLGLAIAKRKDRVSMGVKSSYMNYAIKDYSSKHGLLVEFGILVELNKRFNVGLQAINVTGTQLYQSQYLPTIINLGSCFKASNQVKINAQMEYPVGEKPKLRAGLIYAPNAILQIMSGINPANKSLSFGVGLNIKNYALVFASSSNPVFGLVNCFSLTYNFKRK